MTDQWEYTNAEHTEARKGRWTVKPFGAAWSRHKFSLWHDDFPASLYGDADSDTEWNALLEFRRVMRDFLAWHTAQPAPIAVGDYVRLTGERWGEHMGKVVRVARAESEIEYAAVEIDGAEWYVTPNWTAERITVTADLDDPSNLPMPEVGEHVWVEYANNHGIRAGLVTNTRVDRGVAIEGKYIGGPMVAWGPLNDPADLTPAEPTTFGYVGDAGDYSINAYRARRGRKYDAFHKSGELYESKQGILWPDVLALGTFTAVER